MERVVVTGIGIVSPLGHGAGAFWDALLAGTNGISAISAFDPGPGSPRLAASVADFPAKEHLPAALARRMDRLSRMIGVACRMALLDANALPAPSSLEGSGVVVGSALGNMSETAQFLERVFDKGPALASPMIFPNLVLNAPASQVAIALGWTGPNLTVSEGELSGEAAFEAAVDLVREGRAEAVLAAAGDEIAPVVFRALKDFGYLSPRRGDREWSSPFDRAANGPVAGEAAAALLLERESAAIARGVHPRAVVVCIERRVLEAESPYAWPRSPAPFDLAGVDVVVSGADSSPERDALELGLVAESEAPVVSVKGALGEHGSAGMVNLAVAALALASERLPPMPNLEAPRVDRTPELSRAGRSGPWRRAAVVGAARGGAVARIDLARP